MAKSYHITMFDNFHRHEPDCAWVAGIYRSAEAAIAVVKGRVDHDLKHFWSEVRNRGGDAPLDRLISQYNSFAEMPVAFDDEQGEQIFDTIAYMKVRAAEIIAEAERKPSAGPMSGGES